MSKFCALFVCGTLFSFATLYGQATLPDFTVDNNNGKVSVLWLNQYPKQVTGISVQRAYDSTGNFTSIASIFNPQNTVNGFTDVNPPYEQMYYRLFIGFDTGIYIFTKAKKPDFKNKVDYSELIVEINALYEKNIIAHEEKLKVQEATNKTLDAKKVKSKVKITPKAVIDAKNNATTGVSQHIIDEDVTYPSKRVFTNKDGNVVLNFPDYKKGEYSIKFLGENYIDLFEIKKITDDYFIIEKVNFKHSGWYNFEIYEDGILYEENKFYIPKDLK